jgi:hypothetical protein
LSLGPAFIILNPEMISVTLGYNISDFGDIKPQRHKETLRLKDLVS